MVRHNPSSHRLYPALVLLALLAGCGGGGGSNNGAAPPASTASTLVSLAVTPVEPTINVGGTVQLSATGSYSDGTKAAVTTGLSWSSSTNSATVVTSSGLVTGAKIGSATLSATIGAVSAGTKVTVQGEYVGIAAAGGHTAAVKAGATLFGWGSNRLGQLGDATLTDRLAPTQIGSIATWKFVAGGQFHTAAIRADGSLWTWGYNQNGQLGDGTFVNRLVPTQESSKDTGWVTVSAGGAHTLAIKKDGSLWAWGRNVNGQLGDGTNVDKAAPTSIGVKTPVVTDAAGKAIANVWNSVSAGASHSCARLQANAVIYCWGGNGRGQLGNSTTTDANLPVAVQTATGNFVGVAAAAGGFHTLAIAADGSLYAWGANEFGQLGLGTSVDATTARQVFPSTNTYNWAIVAGGDRHSLAIDSDGNLWAWGANLWGQLGDNTETDRPVPTLIGRDTWYAISAGESHTAAIRSDGTLWTWGYNQTGQLGLGSLDRLFVPAPTLLP